MDSSLGIRLAWGGLEGALRGGGGRIALWEGGQRKGVWGV